jgi:hypothetical protein
LRIRAGSGTRITLILSVHSPVFSADARPQTRITSNTCNPRAIGRKVSDEFTVPLCRIHHRQLHHDGDEARWWNDLGVDPLPIAQELWQQSRKLESQSTNPTVGDPATETLTFKTSN